MKNKSLLVGLLAGTIFLGGMAWAVDYSQYSTEELAKMRGNMRQMSPEERRAFHEEWRKRMREMDPEKRWSYMGPPESARQNGKGHKNGQERHHQGKGWHRGWHKGRGCRR